jgi:hypothetical protein
MITAASASDTPTFEGEASNNKSVKKLQSDDQESLDLLTKPATGN